MAFVFWGLAGAEAVVVAVGQVMVLGSNVPFCLSIKIHINILTQ